MSIGQVGLVARRNASERVTEPRAFGAGLGRSLQCIRGLRRAGNRIR